MKTPNPNLWAVDVTIRSGGSGPLARLFVCAATATAAEKKAAKHARAMGHRSFRVSSVVHQGTIDVF